jgi:pimeloyl-ACP methyl ester carboxylesterase
MSDSEMAELRRTPFWPQIARLSPTLVREWDAIFAFEPTVERYRGLSVPTLLLAGSENADNPTFATADFASSLADVRVGVLNGQGHTANESAPGLVADRIAAFLGEMARESAGARTAPR